MYFLLTARTSANRSKKPAIVSSNVCAVGHKFQILVSSKNRSCLSNALVSTRPDGTTDLISGDIDSAFNSESMLSI